MKLVAKKEAVELEDDPRPRDRVVWNRLRLMVEEEACHPAWGCKLYQMYRQGHITLDGMRAGDKYHQICLDFDKWSEVDPDLVIPEGKSLVLARVERIKRRYYECLDVLRLRRKVVDMVVLREEWPVYEAQKREVANGLEALAIFFERGTKQVRGR